MEEKEEFSSENADCQVSRKHRKEKLCRQLHVGIWTPGEKSGLEDKVRESSAQSSKPKVRFPGAGGNVSSVKKKADAGPLGSIW